MERKSDININAEFYKKLNQQIVQKDALIKLLQKQIEKLSTRAEHLSGQPPSDGIFPNFDGTLREKDAKIEELEGELNHLRDSDLAGDSIKGRIDELQFLLASKNGEIERLRTDLISGNFASGSGSGSDSDSDRVVAASQVREFENIINLKDRTISEQNSRIEALREKCGTQELNLKEYQDSSERTIGELNSRIDELETGFSESATTGMEADRLRTSVAQLEAELEETRLRVAVFSMDEQRPSDEEFESLRQAVGEWRERFTELSDAKRNLEARLDDMMALNENLARKITEQSSTIEEIMGRAEAEAYGRLACEKNELLSQLKRLEDKLSAEAARRKELEARLSAGGAGQPGLGPGGHINLTIFRELISYYEMVKGSGEIDRDKFCEDLFDLMTRNGISKVKTIGYPWDENLHDIVDFVRAPYYGENIIAEEKLEGFVLNGEVLRKAEVTVVRNCLVCPACSTTGREGSNFCDRCGSKLTFPSIEEGGAAPEEIREIGKIAEIYTNIGISYEERGQYDKAASQFQEALKLAPNNPDILGRVASSYELMGRYKDAIDIYEKFRRLKPESKKIATVIENLKVKVSLIEQLKTIRYEL